MTAVHAVGGSWWCWCGNCGSSFCTAVQNVRQLWVEQVSIEENTGVQGEPISSRLHVKVVSIMGLSPEDKAVPAGMLKENLETEVVEKDGVAIEINSPLNAVRSQHN